MKNNKKPAKVKKKMELAKNRAQLIWAVVIFSIFILKTVFDLSNYLYHQHLDNQIANAPATSTSAPAEMQDLSGMSQDLSQQGAQGSSVAPQAVQADANDIYNQTLKVQGKTPEAAGSAMNQSLGGAENMMENSSSMPPRLKTGKMKLITVVDSGRSNPFLPAAENYTPSSLPRLPLLNPPETVATGSDAEKVMGTTISGILYDRYSPSAIIKIGGTDYLVKRGDIINRYKVLNITKDQVIVQLGQNVYKAGVGQFLQQGKYNVNPISNLEHRFGGNEVSVNVKRKVSH